MEELSGNLRQLRCVATGHGGVQHLLRLVAAYQLIQLAALTGHLPDKPASFGLQAAMDGRFLIRLEEVVLGCFEYVAQVLHGFAIAFPLEQEIGLRQFLQDRTFGGKKRVVGRFLGRLVAALHLHRNGELCGRGPSQQDRGAKDQRSGEPTSILQEKPSPSPHHAPLVPWLCALKITDKA